MTEFEAKRILMSMEPTKEIYPAKVARSFGYIENIIETSFKDRIPAQEIVKQIEYELTKIKMELNGIKMTDNPNENLVSAKNAHTEDNPMIVDFTPYDEVGEAIIKRLVLLNKIHCNLTIYTPPVFEEISYLEYLLTIHNREYAKYWENNKRILTGC